MFPALPHLLTLADPIRSCRTVQRNSCCRRFEGRVVSPPEMARNRRVPSALRPIVLPPRSGPAGPLPAVRLTLVGLPVANVMAMPGVIAHRLPERQVLVAAGEKLAAPGWIVDGRRAEARRGVRTGTLPSGVRVSLDFQSRTYRAAVTRLIAYRLSRGQKNHAPHKRCLWPGSRA